MKKFKSKYIIELKNSNVDPMTGEPVKPHTVVISELDVPNYCKNIEATGYKLRKWVEVIENDSKPRYTVEELNRMLEAPKRKLTREEQLEKEVAELRAMIMRSKEDDPELEDLREQYEELYGKKPDGRMKKETLIQRIEDKQ